MMKGIKRSDGSFGKLVSDLPRQHRRMVLPTHNYHGAQTMYMGKHRSMDPTAITRGETCACFQIDPIVLMKEGCLMGGKEYAAILAGLRHILSPKVLDAVMQELHTKDEGGATPAMRKGMTKVLEVMQN